MEKSLVDMKNELNDLTGRLETAQTGKIIIIILNLRQKYFI